MNPAASLVRRSLLEGAHVENASAISAIVNSSSAAGERRPFNPASQFDSGMTLITVILLTALFGMVILAVYIGHFTAADEPSPPSPTTSSSSRPPPTGLDPSTVKSLPLVAYGKAAEHRMVDDCPVCLSEFQETEMVKLIPFCGHVFHSKCIDTWLSSHVSCPVCRSTQLFKIVEEV